MDYTLCCFFQPQKEEKVDELYHQLCAADKKPSDRYPVNKIVTFAAMRELAVSARQSEFKIETIEINQKETALRFLIGRSLIYQSSMPSSTLCLQKYLYADGSVRPVEEITTRSAKAIQRYFRAYRADKEKKIREVKPGDNKDFLITEYQGKLKEYIGSVYFSHRGKFFPRMNINKRRAVSGAKAPQGGNKKVVCLGGDFVMLMPLPDEKGNPGHFLPYPNPRLLHQKIKEAEVITVMAPVIIDKGTMIVRNGGQDVGDIIDQHWEKQGKSILSPSCFKRAARDMMKLQIKGAHLLDIKPNNMGYRDGRVNFIDTDTRQIEGSGEKPDFFATPGYITRALCKGVWKKENLWKRIWKKKEKELDYKMLRTASEYAFLMTMIAATAETSSLRWVISNAEQEEQNNRKFCGVMNDQNAPLFDVWIRRYVKAGYQEAVRDLLKNPYKFGKKNPGHEYLFNMLLFPEEPQCVEMQ